MAPVMFFMLVVLLLLGYPVAFALAANGLLFAVIGIEMGLFVPNFLQALPERVYGTMNNDVLLAIPFFTFMGLILERSGMAEDLLDTIGQLFGPIRGGLAYAVVFVGALLAATTGVVAASVISMGLISLPIMLRYGYDRRVASGVIAASGTLAQIIPPSLVLIVMADQLGRSVGDMYEGAFIPGLVLSALYAGYIFLVSVLRPSYVPALPTEARTLGGGVASLFVMLVFAAVLTFLLEKWAVGHVQKGSEAILSAFAAMVICYIIALANKLLRLNLLSRLTTEVIMVLMPPLGLIFLVLGTIFIGLATPTEGGAMGATGAMIIALAKRRLTMSLVSQALDSTAKLSAFVVFILVGARVFSLTFYGVNGHLWVEELLISLPGGQAGFLIVVNVMVFLLAFFLDFFELAFIVVPLLGPAAEKLGIDLIWFGVILGVNMQTSFMHPPFGFALFYLRSVAPKAPYLDKVTGREMAPITTAQIYWGAVPFVVIQCIMVALVILFPQMVMHYKGTQVQADPKAIEQQLKNLSIPGLDGPGGGLPGLAPPGGGGGLPGLTPPPGPPPGLEAPKPQ
ncbi:TRAP transporter large permease [Rhabdaerophilum calidifontis]|uniref:TRAP transporter large permease n=1 Tax=Rhabdaerophilum calidifontis TaxID=2604328 RepID=UPI00123B0A32|nr:TRAP transporter large permease subunit [Rhabdaerophilum calidifontis]